MCLSMVSFMFLLLEFVECLGSVFYIFRKICKNSVHYSFIYFLFYLLLFDDSFWWFGLCSDFTCMWWSLFCQRVKEIPLPIFELSLSEALSAMMVCIINHCQHSLPCLSALPDCWALYNTSNTWIQYVILDILEEVHERSALFCPRI